MRHRIDVTHIINGSTVREVFTAKEAAICMSIEATTITLIDGRDEQGNIIKDLLYKDAQRVVRTLIDE